MAITYQGAGTAAANTTAGTSLSVAYPASISAGDVIVLVIGCSNATAPTNPTGFTSQLSGTSGGSSPSFRISTKVADGSETGSISVGTPSSTSQGRMLLFRGVDNTTPIDVTGTTFGSSTAVSPYAIPTLTTTTTGATLVYYGMGNAATGSWTPPSGPAAFTEVWDSITITPKSTAGYLIWSSSGATGTVNLTPSASVRGGAGMIALRPAASTTPVSTSRSTTWNVRAGVTRVRSTTWNTIATVNRTRVTTWNVDAIVDVSTTRSTTWDTLSTVTRTRATSWDVLTSIATARATSWDALADVTASRATTWDTNALVSAARSTTWRVLATTAVTRATTWAVNRAHTRAAANRSAVVAGETRSSVVSSTVRRSTVDGDNRKPPA